MHVNSAIGLEKAHFPMLRDSVEYRIALDLAPAPLVASTMSRKPAVNAADVAATSLRKATAKSEILVTGIAKDHSRQRCPLDQRPEALIVLSAAMDHRKSDEIHQLGAKVALRRVRAHRDANLSNGRRLLTVRRLLLSLITNGERR